MPRWWAGWQQARTAGGKTEIFLRMSLPLTLPEQAALRLKSACEQLDASPVKIVQRALLDWLDRYDRGEAMHPLDGTGYTRGPYLTRAKPTKSPPKSPFS